MRNGLLIICIICYCEFVEADIYKKLVDADGIVIYVNKSPLPIISEKTDHTEKSVESTSYDKIPEHRIQHIETSGKIDAPIRIKHTELEKKFFKSNEVKLESNGGVFEFPVVLNGVLKINVILDSGAAEVSLSPDIVTTLIKTKTIKDSDFLPGKIYSFADGSKAKSMRFNLDSLQIGTKILHNVECGIANSINAPILLGQSALQKLGKYTIDYKKGTLEFE